MNDQSGPAEQSTTTPKVYHENYFPTPVFYCDLPGSAALNRDLIKAIRAERAKDDKGIERSNVVSLGGWHSRTDLVGEPAFDALTKGIDEITSDISRRLLYDPSLRLGIDIMWAIINPPGSANRSHIHGGSLWSGVYYVQAPKESGRIVFVDPRTASLMIPARLDPNQEQGPQNWREVSFEPIPGRAVLFPSWLYHRVETNTTDAKGEAADRICVSFNITQKGLGSS